MFKKTAFSIHVTVRTLLMHHITPLEQLDVARFEGI